MKTKAALLKEAQANLSLLDRVKAMKVWQRAAAKGKTALGFSEWLEQEQRKMINNWFINA